MKQHLITKLLKIPFYQFARPTLEQCSEEQLKRMVEENKNK